MKNKTMTKIFLVLFALLLSSCADSANVVSTDIPGFFHGVWHGMILPISFLISFFDSNVVIYAVSNTGHLYDFGFMLGCTLPLCTRSTIKE